MSVIPFDRCQRRRVVIEGENFYEIVGDNFIFITVPYENRPERLKLRLEIEARCRAATLAMGGEYE